MKHKIYWMCLCTFLSIIHITCTDKWLELKSDASLVIPTTMKDFQGLLDNHGIMNNSFPVIGDVGADDYYLVNNVWQTALTPYKDIYIWKSDALKDGGDDVWKQPYLSVFYANVVLEGINKLSSDTYLASSIDNLKGSALFYRAFRFFTLAQVFAKPFNASTANAELGIVIRTSTDVNVPSNRATLQQTYDRIIIDLKDAVGLLPLRPANKFRPSKTAAYALLARIYLDMQDYSNAYLYSDSCLQIDNSLIDYNTLDASLPYPIPLLNDEVIFQAKQVNAVFTTAHSYYVDSLLYRSYDDNDHRKDLFFEESSNGHINFYGSYMGAGISGDVGNTFAGLATDEMYLIRAECSARNGNISSAINDLNTLLETRWKTGSFIPFTATDENTALEKILLERRKETLFRGLRWADLRRLNKDPRFAKTLMRNVNGETYTLPPNDSRYTFLIPQSVIDKAGIQPNERP